MPTKSKKKASQSKSLNPQHHARRPVRHSFSDGGSFSEGGSALSPKKRPQSSALSPAALHGGARAVALNALLEVERRGCFADEALDDEFRRTSLDVRDRALAHEIVLGVLRYRATIDWRLECLFKERSTRLPPGVRNALRIGAYQILCLDKIPQSASVNESVNLVKASFGKAAWRWTGFVNAVLRTLLREAAPSCPDPSEHPIGSLAVRCSLPAWLAERWISRFGYHEAERLGQAALFIPPLTIRANTLRLTRDKLMADLIEAGYRVTPTKWSPTGLILEKCGPLTALRQFHEGAFYVEDEAGQLVPPLLAPQPGERILDACAAPGGKATHLAALMENCGEIIAVDRSARRLERLDENCRRLGVTIIRPVQVDMTDAHAGAVLDKLWQKLGARPFDGILVDAPCTGLGVLKRHPEAKWQKTAGDVKRHHALQLRLLQKAGSLLRPGGRLVYSTCSTETEENQEVIEQFCRDHREYRREPVDPWVPEAGRTLLTSQGDLSTLSSMHLMDAFFACRLRKANT